MSDLTRQQLCAALGISEIGSIEPGKWADLAVLDRALHVRQTYLSGEPAL